MMSSSMQSLAMGSRTAGRGAAATASGMDRVFAAAQRNALLLWGGLCLAAGPTTAAVITVETASDVLALDSRCSLREAVLSANTDTAVNDCAAGSGADVILLTAGLTYQLERVGLNEDLAQEGDLDILFDTTIRPAEESGIAKIDAMDIDRILEVHSGANLTLERMELNNGAGNVFGGALAAFDSGTELRLLDVNINNSEASLRGGAVFTGGLLIWHDGNASNNAAVLGGALAIDPGGSLDGRGIRLSSNDALSGDGGNIYARGPVTCEACRINTAEARSGGGVYMEDDELLTLRSTEMKGNSATEDGGAIHAGRVVLDSVFISGSEVQGDGGAIYLRDEGASLASTVVNSSLTTNAAAGNGGAIVHSGTGTLGIFNSTIAYNAANVDESGSEPTGGIVVLAGTVTARNTVIAPNYALPDPVPPSRGVEPGADCEGTIFSEGHNLFGAVGGPCNITGAQTNDQVGSIGTPLDPQLECAEQFEGVTEFDALAPLPSSPLLDAGEASGCQAPGGGLLEFDAGGRLRVWDGPDPDGVAVCDVGALELGSLDGSLLFYDGYESGSTSAWSDSTGARSSPRWPAAARFGGGGGGLPIPCFGEDDA